MGTQSAIDILRKHTFLTLGCTDPVAIGLAVAHACRISEGEIRGIKVRLDRNIYKDAVSVGIPGTHSSGVHLAAALAAIKGHPESGLELFKDVEPTDIGLAMSFLETHDIRFEIDEEAEGIRIAATVTTEKGVYEALIEGAHNRLVEKRANGKTVYRAEKACDESEDTDMNGLDQLRDLTMEQIFELLKGLPDRDLSFLLEGVARNLDAAKAGLADQAGMELGRSLEKLLENSLLPDSPINRIRILAAAAADARMGGLKTPIFGCYGSGNHGITFFITVGEMGRYLGRSDAEIARALALGLLVIGVIKTRTGILTPHCGCAVAAGTGAAAAIVWLLGGDAKQVESAVQLMTANLTGMLCDGAKYGCALKIATSVGIAIETAYLALGGVTVPSGNGIVGRTFQQTMDNLETVTSKGMKDVDQAVLDVLLAGQN
ncbi:MAG TPA: L-serine ammonia-lyase, iron-sulfur-dependent, subunit alpha [Synergistales bacterium]|nr:L-serine ammonia-lyase, iron-sulfur-dependent, subunit alpha [Synergistales bacterium]